MAWQLGANSVPFTLESYGALSKCASQLIKYIVNAYGELPNAHLSTDSFRMVVQSNSASVLLSRKGTTLLRLRAFSLLDLLMWPMLALVLPCSLLTISMMCLTLHHLFFLLPLVLLRLGLL